MKKPKTMWVSIVPLAYEVMALADDQQTSAHLAATRAAEHLNKSGIVCDKTGEPHTPETIVEWFGVRSYEIQPGSAIVCH